MPINNNNNKKRTNANGGTKTAELWLINYTVPGNAMGTKHVIWRGKTASGAVISFKRIAHPDTEILDTESYLLHYQ